MPANTPSRGYTYATSGDTNDLPLISQRLAEQIDADVASVHTSLAPVTATDTATFAVNTSLWNVSGTPQIIRRGSFWQASITLTQKAAGSISAGWTNMGTVSANARTTGGGVTLGAACVAAPTGPAMSSIDRDTGQIQVLMPAFSGTTSTTFTIALTWAAS